MDHHPLVLSQLVADRHLRLKREAGLSNLHRQYPNVNRRRLRRRDRPPSGG